MNPDKKAITSQLLQRLESAPYMFLVDYTGMTMPQFNEVRKRLRGVEAKLHVTKNSYVKAVGAEKNYPKELEADLKGQTAMVFGDKDICAAAKVIAGATKEFQRPVIKCGVLDGTLLDADAVGKLGAIGSRENMLSMLLGVINAPASALARVINAHVTKSSGPAEEAPAAPAGDTPAAPAEEAPAADATPA